MKNEKEHKSDSFVVNIMSGIKTFPHIRILTRKKKRKSGKISMKKDISGIRGIMPPQKNNADYNRCSLEIGRLILDNSPLIQKYINKH